MVDFLNYISSPMTHSCAISYANASISLWADMRCNGRLVMPCWFLPRPQIFTPPHHPPSSPPSSLCHQPRLFLPLKLCLCVCVCECVSVFVYVPAFTCHISARVLFMLTVISDLLSWEPSNLTVCIPSVAMNTNWFVHYRAEPNGVLNVACYHC